ncbi:MAG: M23 family metallopeptidase [Azovibrio sp.]|uniref:M23 family metallopeptidase n=1 Tax=Azovibrio sp. TaxID=1872673 RepID=UPI003C78EF6E
MQIILVSSHFTTAKTITIRIQHIVAVFVIFLAAVCFGSAILSWLTIQLRLPLVQELVLSMQRQEAHQAERFVKDNLQVMATRLGEMQARMVQLDGLGRRLAEKAGTGGPLRRGTAAPDEPQGGPFIPAPLSEAALSQEIDRLAQDIEAKSKSLAAVENSLRENMVRREFLPTTLPVLGGARLGSPFGLRLDPFGRGRAIHEGLDFVAPPGTPVVAAAGGVVVNAAYHPEFGNLVEINHGGELMTRYAHLASMAVEVGSVVRRGQRLGALGSTGRSTGPHLHFEVKENGHPIDPAVFLERRLARNG